MNKNPVVVGIYKDKYDEDRKIHKTRNGLRVMREKSTVVMELNPRVAKLVGENIKKMRLARGLTLTQLCTLAGLSSPTPKSRAWEIENGIRKEGLRFGTLYAIALALKCEATELLPTVAQVMDGANIEAIAERTLRVTV